MSVTLTARALTRRFGRHHAVAEASLSLQTGDVCALIGPNGAGKSTLLRLLAGVIAPHAGQVDLPRREGTHQVPRVGYLPTDPRFRSTSRIGAVIDDHAALHRCTSPWERACTEPFRNVRQASIRTLSRGWRQRLAWCLLRLTTPDVWLLDEPFSGLEAHHADACLTELVRAAADGAIIVLATHQPTRFKGVLTHVGSMAAGRLAPLVPLSKDRVELSLEVEQGIDRLLPSLMQLEGLVVVATRPTGCSVQIDHAHVPALAKCCVPYGLRSMETVFPPTVGTATHD